MNNTRTDQPAPRAGQQAKAANPGTEPAPPRPPGPKDADGQALPQADGEPPKGSIPPLPEPDVEGVGEESGPSAGDGSDKLRTDQRKMAEDGTGF